MKNDDSVTSSLSRRGLLGQVVGAAGLLSALEATGPANAQAPAAGGGRGGPRVRDSFDFGWKFSKGDAPGAQRPAFADASWKDVDLPHDFSIEGPFSQDAPAKGQGGFLPTGVGWYRKHFTAPESYRGRKVSVEFDGVYQLSEVWINGQSLGKRPLAISVFPTTLVRT